MKKIYQQPSAEHYAMLVEQGLCIKSDTKGENGSQYEGVGGPTTPNGGGDETPTEGERNAKELDTPTFWGDIWDD